jgi:glutamyl-Q tRNA(Asp) synthetase
MHLGHAYAALFAWRAARTVGGRFQIRIEDIDKGRCRPAFADAIVEDLDWLGLDWDGPVMRQSDNLADYGRAIERLEALDVLYPCFCTRSEIRAEIARADAAPHGPDGALYPGTCRVLSRDQRRARIALGRPFALRLNMDKAMALAGPLDWHDRALGRQPCDPAGAGDVVVARKDTPTSYHLAVCVDDHRQGVTLVTRGEDLFQATHIHRLIQALLGLDVPAWHHHPLITDSTGARLAKRNRAMTLRALRQAGKYPAQVRAMIGFES